MGYQLKITIDGIEPPIWRRLKVPGKITFDDLHNVIQAAFGWLNYHLYGFSGDGFAVDDERLEDVYDPPGAPPVVRHSADTTIDELFAIHDRCVYTYDYGDNWRHEVVVEKRTPAEKRAVAPTCLDGARSRPPEDVGGVWGYQDFLKKISKKGPSALDMLAWAEKDTGGRRFDPEYFYRPEVNRRLAHVLSDTPEAAHKLLAARGGLSGALKWGWYGPVVDVNGKEYTWDRLAIMMAMLADSRPVTIKVGPQPTRRS